MDLDGDVAEGPRKEVLDEGGGVSCVWGVGGGERKKGGFEVLEEFGVDVADGFDESGDGERAG